MIKKNRHRAGKKRESILRAQQLAAKNCEAVELIRQVALVAPQPQKPQEVRPENQRPQPDPAIPIVDITDDDTVPYCGPINDESDDEILILSDLPLNHNNVELEEQLNYNRADTFFDPPINIEPLEPLDPDIEFRENVARIFINLEEYAQNIFYNNLPIP